MAARKGRAARRDVLPFAGAFIAGNSIPELGGGRVLEASERADEEVGLGRPRDDLLTRRHLGCGLRHREWAHHRDPGDDSGIRCLAGGRRDSRAAELLPELVELTGIESVTS